MDSRLLRRLGPQLSALHRQQSQLHWPVLPNLGQWWRPHPQSHPRADRDQTDQPPVLNRKKKRSPANLSSPRAATSRAGTSPTADSPIWHSTPSATARAILVPMTTPVGLSAPCET